MYNYSDYKESADYIRGRIGSFVPKILMILGSGLGGLADLVENAVSIPYGEIPGFCTSTAPSHAGRFVFGTIAGQPVAVMQGRLHHYEGYDFDAVSYPVRVARLLGATKMIITNAAGGVNRSFSVGDIMVICDHINFSGNSPLFGANIPEFGVRFPDMSFAYTPKLRELAHKSADEIGLNLREGVYFYSTGPSYETPSEIRAIGVLGGDAVGMSTVSEVLTARHAGMEILGFSLISNMAAGILPQPLTEEEVIEAGENAREKFSALIIKCLSNMEE